MPQVVVISAANVDEVAGAGQRYAAPERAVASTLWNGDVAVIVNEDGTYSVQASSGPIR